MTAEFWGYPYEQSSEPQNVIDAMVSDIWPESTKSGSGTKDAIADGLHPVIALGGMTAADGRPLNRTGVVVSYTAGLTAALSRVRVDIADGKLVYNYVANVLTYGGGAPATFETAPVPGQPVFVDPSGDLAEGVTLSMSPLDEAGLSNPLAGHLWYAQDEMADSAFGGARAASTFDIVLANSLVEQVYCILLTSAVTELA
jgi:hypothetical protein